MAKTKFAMWIEARFKDLASGGIRRLSRLIRTGLGAGAFGGLTRIGGGGLGSRLAQTVATRPGGLGGWISDIIRSASALALLPVRIIAGFASLIPGIGRAVTGAVGTAANILQGLVSVAANIVGGIVNAFGALVSGIAEVLTRVVQVAGRVLGKLAGVAAKVGLGVGAVIAWQMIKGIRENMQLADIRQVLRKLLGGAAEEAEKYARKLSLITPFTPMEVLRATTGIAAVTKQYKRYLSSLIDWAAGAQRPLEEIIMTFQRAMSGSFGEAMEGLRRGLITRADMERAGAKFGGGGQFKGSPQQFVDAMMTAIQRRFRGMAEAAAEVGSGPWSTFVGAIQDLRVSLSQPWYDRFNDALKRMNGWLLRLAQGAKWKALIAWSEQAAKSVSEKLGQAIEWLSTRKWSFSNLVDAWHTALAEMKRVALAFLGLFGGKNAEGKFEFGPLVHALVAAFKWAAVQIQAIFKVLWITVGQDFKNAVAGWITDIGAQVADIAQEAMRENVARAWQTPGSWRWANKPLDLVAKQWEDMTEKERQRAEDAYYRIHMIERAKFTGMIGVGSTLAEVGAGAISRRTRDEKQAAIADVLAKSHQDGAEAAREFSEALDAAARKLREEGVPGAAARIIEAAAPAKTPEDIAGEHPRIQYLRKRIEQTQATQTALERAKYFEAAKGLDEQLWDLQVQLKDLLTSLVNEQTNARDRVEAIREDVKSLNRRVTRLGTARS